MNELKDILKIGSIVYLKSISSHHMIEFDTKILFESAVKAEVKTIEGKYFSVNFLEKPIVMKESIGYFGFYNLEGWGAWRNDLASIMDIMRRKNDTSNGKIEQRPKGENLDKEAS